MSGPVTEIAIVPIKDGYSVESGEGKAIWDVTLKTISEQKGFKRGSWGVQIENPDVAQMAIDWESLDAHKAFIASDAYGPFMERLKPLFGGTPHLYHVKIPASSATSPFDAPVTECIALYFDQAFDEAAYEQSFSDFATEAGKVQGSEASGLVGGWSVETHKFDGEGNDKKFFGAFIGWPSVESHMEFRKNEAFPGVVAHLREGVDKVKMHHVAFKPFKA